MEDDLPGLQFEDQNEDVLVFNKGKRAPGGHLMHSQEACNMIYSEKSRDNLHPAVRVHVPLCALVKYFSSEQIYDSWR